MLNVFDAQELLEPLYCVVSVVVLLPLDVDMYAGERRPPESHIILKELLRFFTEVKVIIIPREHHMHTTHRYMSMLHILWTHYGTTLQY